MNEIFLLIFLKEGTTYEFKICRNPTFQILDKGHLEDPDQGKTPTSRILNGNFCYGITYRKDRYEHVNVPKKSIRLSIYVSTIVSSRC